MSAVVARVAGLVLLSAVLPVHGAHAFHRSTSESDSTVPLWWPESKRNLEFRVNVMSASPLPSSDLSIAFRHALEAWSFAGDCTDLYLTQGADTSSTNTNRIGRDGADADRINTVVWRNEDWPSDDTDYTDTDTIALTTVAYVPDTGEIVDADIDVNQKFFTWSASTTPPAGANVQDVQNVITHELGHAIGIAHSDIPTASMWARSSPGNIEMRSLDEDDIDAVCTVYPIGAPTPKERSSSGLTSTNSCNVTGPGRAAPSSALLLMVPVLAFAFARRAKRQRRSTR